jgi:hypothetical protein
MSYCPYFWNSRLIYEAHDTQYISEGRFRELLTIVLGFHVYLQEYDSLYILESNEKKLFILHLWPFIAHSFRVPG